MSEEPNLHETPQESGRSARHPSGINRTLGFLGAIFGTLVGAYSGYMLLSLSYFKDDPFYVWLSIGGIGGGWIGADLAKRLILIPCPPRRWFRISLRTLLVLVTIACAGFGWLGVKVRQAQAAKAIKESGGWVRHDYEYDAEYNLISAPIPPGPAWLRSIVGDAFFANAIEVHLHWHASDADLSHLQGLPQLKFLYIEEAPVTDAALVHLDGLANLKLLWLTNTKITKQGCQELQKSLPQLSILR